MLAKEGHTASVVGSFPKASSSSSLQPESKESIDQSLEILAAQKDEWLKVGIDARLQLLEGIRKKLYPLREEWVRKSISERGWSEDAFHLGFEWGVFACILRGLRVLQSTLQDIQRNGRPVSLCKLRMSDNGQVVARVFPQNFYDRSLYMQTTADIYMEPGETISDVKAGWAKIYNEDDQAGRICLVLAAGNSAQITPLGLLQKLFVENEVVILKTNPVNAYLTPFLEVMFAEFVQQGWLQFVSGGVEEGVYLCQHDAVDSIQLTGSDKTFEAIFYGTGEDAQLRKEEKRPLLKKPMQAELGSVSPIIVVPSQWSEKDIALQAELIASWMVSNGAFNCLTPRVLITHKEWPQRETFLQAVRQVLSKVPTVNAFYPGAPYRYKTYQAAYPEMECYGVEGNGRLPWGIIPDVNAQEPDNICFTAESYCGILADVPVSAENAVHYLSEATDFANNSLWGNLSMTMILDQKSLQDPEMETAFKQALTNLRYGTIGVNFSIPMAYFLAVTPWGAYSGNRPENRPENIQSGIGFTNSFLMFDKPQKSIFQAPFRKLVEPVRVGSKNMVAFGRNLVDFEANPSMWTFSKVTMSAMKC